ncbi:MAG: 2-dehydropantoate 2-reductase N-terminal domain-containing protein [archaeon]
MKIMIYGAGAMGRGFLAPTFFKQNHDIYFVDNNLELVNELKSRNQYKTAFSNHNGKYDIVTVDYKQAFFLGEEDKEIDNVDLICCCVGPNNVKEIAHKFTNAKTILSFENEYESVENIKQLSGNANCYFGVPDVITSCSSPIKLRKIDSLCLVSEYGEIALEKGNYVLDQKTYSLDDLIKYWNCKFYVHNAPHAVVSFLGKKANYKYMHQAMNDESIKKQVEVIMNQIKIAMKLKGMADPDFVDYYAQKELVRFADKQLYDPISRVSRDPLRKLKPNDRLIKSLYFIYETNQDILPMISIIKVVIDDAIINYNKKARKVLGETPTKECILTKICKIEKDSNLYNLICK